MTDQQRIEQLEQQNLQLRHALKRFVESQYWGIDLDNAVKTLRKRSNSALEEAAMLEELIPLLKDTQ